MVTVEINGKRKRVPSAFNELSLKQLKVYIHFVEMRKAELFTQGAEGITVKDGISLIEAKVALLYAILGVKFRRFLRIRESQMVDLITGEKLIDFFFQDRLTENKVPVIHRNFSRNLYGPVSRFYRIRFGEFNLADAAFSSFHQTGKIEYLDELIAILYRPAKKGYDPRSPETDGDIREAFNLHTVDFRMPAASRMRLKEKLCIYVWFDHCRRELVDKYDRLFKKNAQEKEKDPGASWVRTAMGIGGGALQFRKVLEVPVYEMFEDLTRLMIESEERKKELEEMKKKQKR